TWTRTVSCSSRSPSPSHKLHGNAPSRPDPPQRSQGEQLGTLRNITPPCTASSGDKITPAFSPSQYSLATSSAAVRLPLTRASAASNGASLIATLRKTDRG